MSNDIIAKLSEWLESQVNRADKVYRDMQDASYQLMGEFAAYREVLEKIKEFTNGESEVPADAETTAPVDGSREEASGTD